MMDRRELCRAVLAERGDMLVVAGLGAPAWDITAVGDCAENLPLWGGMGGAAMLGLGLALAQPSRTVLVITGDGEMLMGLGSLATVAVKAPPNLSILVQDNEHYGERRRWRGCARLSMRTVVCSRSRRWTPPR